ncbi:MAG: hypothetical protein ABR577_11325 [Pyrinomonadaceae bacterium]
MPLLKFHPKNFACAVLLALLFACAMVAHALAFADGGSTSTAAGTLITNRAEATYEDETGTGFATVSPTISVLVLPVAALVVTPDDTAPSATVAPFERVTRLFQICNTGNTPDLYTIAAADANAPAELVSLHFDTDASGTLTDADAPARLNETMSPRLAPGKCTGVLAVFDTKNIAPQSTLALHLTARSNVVTVTGGQMAQNDGTIINAVGEGARLTAPDNAQLPPVKLVENKDRAAASAGQALTYSIAFRNRGGIAARRVRLIDELPANLEYVANSLRLGTRTLTDADDADEGVASATRIEVRLNEVAIDELVQVSFKARVIGSLASGTGIVNAAVISGDNFAPVNTSEAIAIVDPFGTVYAGHSQGATRIGGAHVSLLTDQTDGSTLTLPQGAGFVPNEANDNPFSTDAQGRFAFALTPEQLGTTAQPARYMIAVNAPSYRQRLLEISLRPTSATSGLFEATVRALDNQPLARGGSFETTTESVELAHIASVALNIPMFENSALEITKTADKQRAEIGDIVSYRVEVHNASAAPVQGVRVSDQLPPSFHYAENTARIETSSDKTRRNIEPEATGSTLAFNVGDLGGSERATISYRIRVGANARDGEQINSAIASATFPSGEQITTATAHASVNVGRGVFSTRQIIIGRVFEDANNNGQFDAGDSPVAGTRVYLNNGQSVITDSAGQYNIPSTGEGSIVLSIDPITIPQGLALADENHRDGRSWTRLLRTPLGGGALLRQNFALVPSNQRKDSARTFAYKTSLADEATQEKSSAPQTPATDLTTTARLGDQLPKAANGQLASGTYEVASTESLKPVAPGDVLIVSPGADDVVMTPALSIEARVHESWTVAAEVNGERIGDSNIGVRRVDHKNEISTFGFVGINLRPGPNRVKVSAVNPAGAIERTVEQIVYGRGAAKRLEIVTDKNSLQAGGRDSMQVRVRAFDQWGHPAADGQIALETSAGHFLKPSPNANAARNSNVKANAVAGGLSKDDPSVIASPEQANENVKQQIVSLSGGEAVLQLFAENSPDTARLHAVTGDAEARTEVRFTPEVRPAILVGLAEMSFGRAAPEISEHGDDSSTRRRLAFFYRGSFFGNENLLTLAYDSARSLNRTAGRDRLFQLDPLDRAYPIFGDSSTRFEDAQSNSKLYARLDRNRSYAMFGDFDAGMDNLSLSGYARKLTGVKLHVENAHGDFITATGARPDTTFARDVIPGGTLSLVRLSNGDVLPGSETVVLEVRDRRNPEIILSRETLVRSIDYNLDPANGAIFFIRPVSTFDYQLNLVQAVVTYEHRTNSMAAAVYTARAGKRFDRLGLRLGLSAINQRQGEFGSFMLGGIDGEKDLPRGGHLKFELATSRGRVISGGNVLAQNGAGEEHNGNAFRADLEQPLGFYGATLRANFSRSDANYLNPFGATVAPGAERIGVSLDLKPRASRSLHLGLLDERNRTANVSNNRVTASLGWNETWRENFRTFFGYDYRKLNDDVSAKETSSNLVTAGAEYRPFEKLELSIKREQNIGEADPTYPNQTTLSAKYQVNQLTRIFLTERLASAAIKPIADVAGTGFASTNARHETAIGVETRLWQHTALNGRYQIENGINGADSFAVIGLQNSLPISKTLSLELGYERGFHLAGEGASFNNATIGFSWQPLENFRSSARYELRDRNGFGQSIAIGAAGKLTEGITALARLQWARASLLGGRGSASFNGTAALALRPLESDRAALLFSYTRRSLMQEGDARAPLATRDRADTLSSDGLFQATKNLELYGRFALKFSANGDNSLAYTSALTYLVQARAQERLGRYIDFAGEMRMLAQPSSGTRRASYGAELGVWATSDLRLGVGYNFTSAVEPQGGSVFGARRGFYFNISSKLSNLFDLFGTSQQGLASGGDSVQNQAEPQR